jgi:transcriptional regulator with GAF, ATPase, and Fis domain
MQSSSFIPSCFPLKIQGPHLRHTRPLEVTLSHHRINQFSQHPKFGFFIETGTLWYCSVGSLSAILLLGCYRGRVYPKQEATMSKSTQLQQETISLEEKCQVLEQETQTLLRYLEMIQELYWAGQKITTRRNLLYALNQLLYKVMVIVSAKDGSISRLDEAAGELVFLLVHGELGHRLPDYRLKSNIGIAGWVVSNRKPIIVNNPQEDPRFSNIIDEEFGFFTSSIVSVPIMNQDKPIGVIQLLNKASNEFTEADVALLLNLGQVTALVFEEMKSRPETEEIKTEDTIYL